MERKYGRIVDIEDAVNDWKATFSLSSIPKTMSLADSRPPIMDQSAAGSCVMHGIPGVIRHHLRRRYNANPTSALYDREFSALFGYYNGRELENTIPMDTGLQIRDGIKVVAQQGLASIDLWPYDLTKLYSRPPQEAYDDAVQYKAQSYARVGVSASAVRTAVAAYHPVVIGIPVYESFEAVGSDGLVPMPEKGEKLLGGHCMYVDEYEIVPGHFTVPNSYGLGFGRDGVCYIPYDYIGTLGSDYWVIDMFGTDAAKIAGLA